MQYAIPDTSCSRTEQRRNVGSWGGQQVGKVAAHTLLLSRLLSSLVLMYLEISCCYWWHKSLKCSEKLLMNQHNFCITITWFFYLLTKYELICIRETCIGVEKYICAVTLILAYYSWIQSFIHLFIPHVRYTCRVQRQSTRTHGKQTQIQMELSCYLFQSLITIFSHAFSGQNVYQPEQLIILSRTQEQLLGMLLPHM